ncbi:MAG: hypothetical protein KF849_05350 [Rhizobiaceae bacterium]|nr:hypothetical protein [Rhizobiaceae bacterium]
MNPPLRLLLAVNAVATAAAGIVLFVWPAAIPGAVGIALPAEANFVAWLLGSAELGLAALCAVALRATEPAAIRLVCWTMLVTHATAAVADMLALGQGVAPVAVGINLAVRLAMVVLFWQLGLRR